MDFCNGRRKFLLCALLAAACNAFAAPRVVDLSIVRRKPDGGVRTARLAKGDVVTLRVRSDESLGLHLHGYEVALRAKAGEIAEVTFTANLVGRFPLAAHVHDDGSGRKAPEPTLLYLEVHPE